MPPSAQQAQGKTIDQQIANSVDQDIRSLFTLVKIVAERVKAGGGQLFLVGGFVRDELLDLPVKDLDAEVYGLPESRVSNIVYSAMETVKTAPLKFQTVGRSFGVIKISTGQSELDIALPRREKKTELGHRGFSVDLSPTLEPARAVQRRDFTINALLQDPLTGKIHDFVGGLDDLHGRTLRMVNKKTFGEDPLRVLRAWQFVARFELSLDPTTQDTMRAMLPSLSELSLERTREEWSKLFLRAHRPSLGLQAAFNTGFFHYYLPAIAALAKTPQDPEHHPEGNCWVHTLLSVDQAKDVMAEGSWTTSEQLIILLAVWAHDFGKATTTQMVEGRVRALGHDRAGVVIANDFLRCAGFPSKVGDQVIPLVREHMTPAQLFAHSHRGVVTDGAMRRLAQRLHPANIRLLAAVTEADYRGRGPFPGTGIRVVWPRDNPAVSWLLERMAELQLQQRPAPVLWGRDLVSRGWPPGPMFGQALDAAERLAQSGWSREQIIALLAEPRSPAEDLQKLQRAASELKP